MEIIALLLFVLIFLFILLGYPVALALGGVSVVVGFIFLGPDFFLLLPSRIMGVLGNYVLIAVPLFIFMGVMFQRSGLAERLLEQMARLFGRSAGGLAVSTIVVGALLAASTGIVGATVVTMGLISLPTMLKHGYKPSFAAGTVVSSGTLGQVIPPSIVLVLLGSVLSVSVGKLFAAAVVPGIILIGAYILFSVLKARFGKGIENLDQVIDDKPIKFKELVITLMMPLFLIIAVLGSIFAGIASPTEAAALGAAGATLLTAVLGKLKWPVLRKVARETTHITSMVFFILLGATTFALVFRGLGGDDMLTEAISGSTLGPKGFLILVLLFIFIAGFFIDFIEIIFIFVPVLLPVMQQFELDLIWVGILFAINLQTSFLTPPFGFSLFYLKGVAPPEIRTKDIYRGVIPFLLIQLAVLSIVFLFPDILQWVLLF